MHIKTRLQAGAVGLAVLVLAACSSDSNPAGGGGGGGGGSTGAAALQSAQIQPPTPLQNAANADPGGGAATGVGYFTQFNSLTSFASWLSPPAPVRGRVNAAPAADTTTWTEGSLTITLVITEAGDTTYTYYAWEVYLNGSDQFNTYDNFLFMFGSHETGEAGGTEPVAPGGDRSALLGADAAYILGGMTIYDRANPPAIEFNWTWGIDPIGRTIGTNRYGPTNDPDDITIQVEPDGSGSIELIENAVVRYRAVWLPNGTGTWTTFNPVGDPQQTGTF